MSVQSTDRKENFTLDQVEDEFDFSFRALTTAPGDIKCATLTGSTTTLLTYLTDYTVAIESDGVGGTVTLNDATAVSKGTLTIYRETSNKQESDYEDFNNFPADTVETDFDRRTMIAQEQNEDVSRTVKLPITSSLSDVELPLPVSNEFIGWNAAADALEGKTVADLSGVEKASVADAIASTDDDDYMTASKVATLLSGGNAVLSVGATVITTLTVGTLSSAVASVGTLTVGTLSVVALSTGTLTVSAIKFPATQIPSADVNTLDDYEEGTFTPTISFDGDSTGITYSANEGSYTKIGNQVTVRLNIVLTDKGAETGGCRIEGLPFNVAGKTIPTLNTSVVTFANQLTGYINDGTNVIILREMVEDGSNNFITEGNVADNSQFNATVTYLT